MMIVVKAHRSKESTVALAPPPGRRMEGFSFVPLPSKGRGVAEGREELLGLLRDLPESDYELSLTDIVENRPVASGSSSDEKATQSHEGELNQKTRVAAKEKKKTMVSSSSSSSFRSSSDGVLLNVYLPTSLTRSLTAPRMSKGPVHRATTECKKRGTKAATLGCWPPLWLRGKPRREVAAKIK